MLNSTALIRIQTELSGRGPDPHYIVYRMYKNGGHPLSARQTRIQGVWLAGFQMLMVYISVVFQNTLNLDPDPEFWPNLDQDVIYQFLKNQKKIKKILFL